MLKILHYSCEQDHAKNCSCQEHIESHLVSYLASPNRVFIVKSRWTNPNMTVSIHEYKQIVDKTVSYYMTPPPYVLPKQKCQTKYNVGDWLVWENLPTKFYFIIKGCDNRKYNFVYPVPQLCTLKCEFCHRIDSNPRFRKATDEEIYQIKHLTSNSYIENQLLQVTESGKIEPVETTNNMLRKKEIEIWQQTYNTYMKEEYLQRLPSGKIFELCNTAVEQFRKTFKGE